ncbi:MAG: hypothetical protein QNJ46_23740 [Leptolyngbyaceae cyanobacterium MO_188.B28]|nr:hypothetical protein [Leptolyngbyaceae cyanobacterium MO_188.B28]
MLHGEKRSLEPDEIAPDPGQVDAAKSAITPGNQPKQTKPAQKTAVKVNAIIDAILAFNDTPGRSHGEKWTISFPIVKELGKPIGATYQKVILQVLAERGEESEAHHENHGIGKYHNRGKDYGQLPQVIQVQADWGMSE